MLGTIFGVDGVPEGEGLEGKFEPWFGVILVPAGNPGKLEYKSLTGVPVPDPPVGDDPEPEPPKGDDPEPIFPGFWDPVDNPRFPVKPEDWLLFADWIVTAKPFIIRLIFP